LGDLGALQPRNFIKTNEEIKKYAILLNLGEGNKRKLHRSKEWGDIPSTETKAEWKLAQTGRLPGMVCGREGPRKEKKKRASCRHMLKGAGLKGIKGGES